MYPFVGGSHSIERAADGNMWITQAGSDSLAEVFVDGVTIRGYFPLPRIGDDPGRLSAHAALRLAGPDLDDADEVEPRSPASIRRRRDVDVPSACPRPTRRRSGSRFRSPTAATSRPTTRVWWSQLFGDRIGHYDPATDTHEGVAAAVLRAAAARARIRTASSGCRATARACSAASIRRSSAGRSIPCRPASPARRASAPPRRRTTSTRTARPARCGSTAPTPTRLIRFEPEERSASPPSRSRRARASRARSSSIPTTTSWTCTSNEPPGPDERGTRQVRQARAAAAGRRVRQRPARDRRGVRRRQRDRLRRLQRATAGSRPAAATASRCGGEQCDDGNADDCDGCSSTCQLETGLLCGDGIVNAACGEECDPPVPGHCSLECHARPGCGDGIVDPGEACDDGNTDDCDGCTSKCTLTAGCGDGVVVRRRGVRRRQHDELRRLLGRRARSRTGAVCGDGIVNAACGEECDPPQAGPLRVQLPLPARPAQPLGTRHFSFGGALYSSALGTSVPLGLPEGALDLVGRRARRRRQRDRQRHRSGRTSACRSSAARSATSAAASRPAPATSTATAAPPADVLVEQDSAGPGVQGNPVVTTTGLGADGGPGTVAPHLRPVDHPGESAGSRLRDARPIRPISRRSYTTGSVTGDFLNGDPRIGTGQITVAGEAFACSQWSIEDGPGVLARLVPPGGGSAGGRHGERPAARRLNACLDVVIPLASPRRGALGRISARRRYPIPSLTSSARSSAGSGRCSPAIPSYDGCEWPARRSGSKLGWLGNAQSATHSPKVSDHVVRAPRRGALRAWAPCRREAESKW